MCERFALSRPPPPSPLSKIVKGASYPLNEASVQGGMAVVVVAVVSVLLGTAANTLTGKNNNRQTYETIYLIPHLCH